jgi:hypothetical protein
MSNLSRRAILCGTAAAAAIATPAIAATGAGESKKLIAVARELDQPIAGENAELLSLGQGLDEADREVGKARTHRRDARAACEALWPDLPEEIACRHDDPRYRLFSEFSERETDAEGREVWPPNYIDAKGRKWGRRPTLIYKAALLRDALEQAPDRRCKDARELKRKLGLAEVYESGIEKAKASSGIEQAVALHEDAMRRLKHVCQQISASPATTIVGLGIKARAIAAIENIQEEQSHRWILARLASSIARDIERLHASNV